MTTDSNPNSSSIFSEHYISLTEACKMFPNGKVSRASLEQWWRNGVRRTTLKTFVIGHRRYTTATAIREFVEAQQADAPTASPGNVVVSRREREISAAEKKVEQQLKY